MTCDFCRGSKQNVSQAMRCVKCGAKIKFVRNLKH